MSSDQSNETREVFSRNLKIHRKRAGFRSARAFAETLGIDENRYTRYERAEVEPSFTLFMDICGKLGVVPNDLFGITTEQPLSGRAIGSPMSHAAGFAELASGDSGKEWSTAGPVQEAAGSNSAGASQTEVRSEAWKLAEFMARLELGLAPDGDMGSFEAIEATSRIYRKIVADPFGFITQSVLGELLAKSSAEVRDEFAHLARSVTTAIGDSQA